MKRRIACEGHCVDVGSSIDRHINRQPPPGSAMQPYEVSCGDIFQQDSRLGPTLDRYTEGVHVPLLCRLLNPVASKVDICLHSDQGS